jgi:hypothetical protein
LLGLFFFSDGVLDVAPLASLHQLEELTFDPVSRLAGLQAVLSSCPQVLETGV